MSSKRSFVRQPSLLRNNNSPITCTYYLGGDRCQPIPRRIHLFVVILKCHFSSNSWGSPGDRQPIFNGNIIEIGFARSKRPAFEFNIRNFTSNPAWHNFWILILNLSQIRTYGNWPSFSFHTLPVSTYTWMPFPSFSTLCKSLMRSSVWSPKNLPRFGGGNLVDSMEFYCLNKA